MALTLEELKENHNNLMSVMAGCDRKMANLIANEVLDLDRDAEILLNNKA